MLTHVNDDFRFKKLKKISQFIDAGIAFSNHHKKFIEKKSLGVKKIFYVLPPTDNDVKLKKLILEYLQTFTMMEEKKKITFFNSFINQDPNFLNYQLLVKVG